MSVRIACMIWCEECVGRNWLEIDEWIGSGRAVVCGGTLKVSLRCGSCDTELAPEERVQTVTLHNGLLAAAEWAAEYVLFSGAGEKECEGGAEGV